MPDESSEANPQVGRRSLFLEYCPELGENCMVLKYTLDWLPASKKNNQRIVRFGKRASIRPGKRWDADCKRIKLGLAQIIKGAYPIIPDDHDIGIYAEIHIGKKVRSESYLTVEFWDLGPAPRRGTGRDIDNCVQGVLDAAQGLVFKNDGRVSVQVIRRIRDDD